MTWFRVDDSFGDHPKVDALADGGCFDSAIALWVLAGAWCAKHLTDGHIPTGRASRLGVSKWKRAAAELVRVGLWIVVEDGWQFHDWTRYQPTRETVTADRAKVAERVRRHRNRPVGNAVTSPVTNGVSNDAPVPSRPDPTIDQQRSGDLQAVIARGRDGPAAPPSLALVPPSDARLAEQAWSRAIGDAGGRWVTRPGEGPHFRAVVEAVDSWRGTESLSAALERRAREYVTGRRDKRYRAEWWAEHEVEAAARAGAQPRKPGESPAADRAKALDALDARIREARDRGDIDAANDLESQRWALVGA